MFFLELHKALVDHLRTRVYNGQATERGLAKIVGISQPHMHNVLSGKRSLSPEASDQILFHLRLSLFDLVDHSVLSRHLETKEPEAFDASCYVPLLRGSLGPGHPWPATVERHEYLRLPEGMIAKMQHPVLVKLAADARMQPRFSDGDLALLDQSHRARTLINPSAYYVLKLGGSGLVRRLRQTGHSLYLISEDVVNRQVAWECLKLEQSPVSYFVRARATLVPPDRDWA